MSKKRWLASTMLSCITGISHGFGTRFTRRIHQAGRSAYLKQVHGNAVIMVERAGFQGEADAMITSVSNILLTVKTADCLPILFCGENPSVVGAIHAGWRGLASGVIYETIKTAAEHYGLSPDSLKVAIGPAIEERCYEVGSEVIDRFRDKFEYWQDVVSIIEGRASLNLRKSAEIQLKESGVSSKNIEQIELCTYCRKDLFSSHRRDKGSHRRMYSFIAIGR